MRTQLNNNPIIVSLIILLVISFFAVRQIMIDNSPDQEAAVVTEDPRGQVLGATTNGLVGYWKFNEGSGTTISDSSGNDFVNSITGTTSTWVAGKYGGAIDLGTNSYVKIPYTSILTGLSNITLSTWVQPKSKELNAVLGCINGEEASGSGYLALDTSGTEGISVALEIGSKVDARRVNKPIGSTWHNLTYMYDGNFEKIYLDGEEVGSFAKTGSLHSNTECGLILGKRYSTDSAGSFAGSIDDVRVYNRALSPQEISDIYNDTGAASSESTPLPASLPANSASTPPPATPAATAPSISSFSSSASSINVGQAVTLYWSVSGTPTPTISINNNVGTVTGSSRSISPTTTTTYTLTATNSHSTVTRQVTVTVNPLVVTPPPIVTPPALINHSPSGTPSGNGIIISNTSNQNQTNYPVQIGRPFLQGEINNFPQASLSGVGPVPTQADVKQRWPDGSVKHAIISFLVPNFPTGQNLSITFQNQSSGNNTALTKTEMLAGGYDFDAVMELTNAGVKKSASARTMLSNGDYTLWTSGQIAQTIILADHSAARKYDIGFDSYKPFRPIFQATFWPGINKVEVRYIGEVSNTEELEDVTFDLNLKLGLANSQSVYSKLGVTNYPATRWTKEFWLGGKPLDLPINHNFPYLIQTKFLPNYDLSKVISQGAVSNTYNNWLSKPRDLYETGNIPKSMGNAGGRAEIGPLPGWAVWWLYTFDNRLKEVAFGNADLAAAYPMHFREGDPTKFLDRAKTVPGIGKIMSISSRPSLVLSDGNNLIKYSYTKSADKMDIVGPFNNGGWIGDNAHQPDMFSVQYLLTGDFWYLEELWFWNSYGAAHDNGAAPTASYGRGPTGAEGGLRDANVVRSNAWPLRNRAEGAFVSPDNAPEKTLIETWINDAIAEWEGERGVTGTQFQNTPLWNWGKNIGVGIFNVTGIKNAKGPSPLHFWGPGIDDARNYQFIDEANVLTEQANWMQDYLLYVLGRVEELGYPTGPLKSWLAVNRLGQINDPSTSWYNLATYTTPVAKRNGLTYYTSWAEVNAEWDKTWDFQAYYNGSINDADHGYVYILMNALSQAYNEPGGKAAWDKAAAQLLCRNVLNNNPKWVILPRGYTPNCANSTPPPIVTPPTTPPTNSAPVVSSFTVSPSTITSGQSSTLSWIVSGTPTPTLSINPSTGSGPTAVTGTSKSVSPSQTTTYTLTAANSQGSVTKTVTVTVSSSTPPANPRPPKTVTITFEGTSKKNIVGKIEIYQPNTKTKLSELSITPNTSGQVTPSIATSSPNSVDIRIVVPGYLPKIIRNVDLTQSGSIDIGQLTAGDFNNDGIINSLDYSAFSKKWNQTTSIDLYDVNKDGTVNSLDFGIINLNWNKVGD